MRKFGIRDKFGYLFGDFGNDFFFMLVCIIFNGILYRCISSESGSSWFIVC